MVWTGEFKENVAISPKAPLSRPGSGNVKKNNLPAGGDTTFQPLLRDKKPRIRSAAAAVTGANRLIKVRDDFVRLPKSNIVANRVETPTARRSWRKSSATSTI
eukprot:6253494-Pyramimonas_sp.AAC.2